MNNQERQREILDLIKGFCAEKLNDEYVEIAERLIAKLARKRINPMEVGKSEVWAAGIIHALGTINELFNKSSEPHARVEDVNAFFKTNESLTVERSRQIQEILNLGCWNDEFSIHKMRLTNPFNKLVFVNGFLVPLDSLPPEYLDTLGRRE
jgi:hypothetical protein